MKVIMWLDVYGMNDFDLRVELIIFLEKLTTIHSFLSFSYSI
jgi:hypothetical protein